MDVQLLRGIIMYKRKKNQPYYTNRHSCFLLQYNLHFFSLPLPFLHNPLLACYTIF